jgi:MFS family permease
MKKNIYLLCAISFFQGLVFYGPIATIFRQTRGISLYEIFVLASILMVSMILLEIPWGYFADKFGYKKTLLLSYFLFFVSKIAFYYANSFSLFLVETLLMALAFSGMSGCDSALLYSSVDEKDSEKAFSYCSASGAAGLFAASFASTFIVQRSMDLTALYTVISYGIAFILALFLKDIDYKKQNLSIKSSMKNALKNKLIFLFVISIALVSETTHSVAVFLNQPQYLKSGIGIKYFGILTAFMQIICILSARAYKLSRKFGQKKLVTGLFILITAVSFLLAFTRNPFLSILIIALLEGAFALCQPLSQDIQNKSITTGDRATLLSTYAMVGDIIGAFTNLAIGKASDISLEAGLILCGALSGAAVILVYLFFRKLDISNHPAQESIAN